MVDSPMSRLSKRITRKPSAVRALIASSGADSALNIWDTTTGQIVLLGVIRPGARYDLRSYAGDVHVLAVGEPAAFELRARSAVPVESAFALRGVRRRGDWTLAFSGAGGAGSHAALLEVSSTLAHVVIQPRSVAELR